MGYANVTIQNNTPYQVQGTVHYPSAFCSNDDFGIGPNGTWTAGSRGLCLVSEITAQLLINGNWVGAGSYESFPGTSFSSFAVKQNSDGTYSVYRPAYLGTGKDTEVGELQAEPTEQQK